MAWFHFRNDPGITQPAAMLFKDEARRRAMNFVGLPEPLSEAVGPPAADWVARRN
jgi:hypothetical protein